MRRGKAGAAIRPIQGVLFYRIMYGYAVVASVLGSLAYVRDMAANNAYLNQQDGTSGLLNSTGSPGLVVILGPLLLCYYMVRAWFLIQLRRQAVRRKGRSYAFIAGLGISIVAEVLILYCLFWFVRETTAGCNQGGDFSACGWSAFILFWLYIGAGLLQMTAMVLGGILGTLLHHKVRVGAGS